MPTSSVNPPSLPPINPENEYHKVTIGEVLHYWWVNNAHQNDSNNYSMNSSPTPPQIWVIQNVYPLVTPMRIFCFSFSLISFLLAYGFFMETDFYKSSIGVGSHGHGHGRPLLFFMAAIGHTVWLIFLVFFGFCAEAYERYRYHYVLKSVGEIVVMLLVSLLILGIGHKHHHNEAAVVSAAPASVRYGKVEASEVAGLLTCGFLVIDALCIVILLKPGHHYSVLEATATLTLHLGLLASPFLGVSALCFIFVILLIKNFLWRETGLSHSQSQAHTNEHHHQWVRVALQVV